MLFQFLFFLKFILCFPLCDLCSLLSHALTSLNLSLLLPAERVKETLQGPAVYWQQAEPFSGVAETEAFMLHYLLLASFAFPRGSESGPTMQPLLGIVNIVNAGGY